MDYLLLFSLLFSGTVSAKTLYIKSLKAPVLKEAKAGAAPVTTLERGTPVEEIKKVDKFVEISSAGTKGFVNQLFLSEGAPVPKKESLLDKDVDIGTKARKRASGFTSAAAARGLKEDSDDIFSVLGEEDGERILQMEKSFVDSEKGQSFLSNPKEKL